MSDTTEEKSLPPTDKKLRDGRKKGQVQKCRELTMAVVTFTCLGYLVLDAGPLTARLERIIRETGAASGARFDQALPELVNSLVMLGLQTLMPVIGIVITAVIGVNILVQRGMIFAIDPITPKADHLNPAKGFKRIVSVHNLIELIKNVLKTLLVGAACFAIIRASLQPLVEEPSCGLQCLGPTMFILIRPLLLSTAFCYLVIGAVDLRLQKWLFRREMKMTKTEFKRETIDTNGNPLIKGRHREDHRSSVENPLRAGVRNAAIVIAGRDVAAALRYAPPEVRVPLLIARASGEGAAPLIEAARGLGLPIVFEPRLACLILDRLKVGQVIRQDMFQPVIDCMRESEIL